MEIFQEFSGLTNFWVHKQRSELRQLGKSGCIMANNHVFLMELLKFLLLFLPDIQNEAILKESIYEDFSGLLTKSLKSFLTFFFLLSFILPLSLSLTLSL